MKVGNIIDGLAVIDVKRVNKMNLIQFTKAVSEYIEKGYKIDVHSSRQVGLVLTVDMYKLENNFSGSVGSIGEASPIEDSPTEDVVKEPNETTLEAIQESTEKLEAIEPVEAVNEVNEDSPADTSEADKETKGEAEVEQTPPVKKATRTKKQTT